jgi:hypothetical protein
MNPAKAVVIPSAEHKIASKSRKRKINVTAAKIRLLQHFMKFGREKHKLTAPKPKGSKYQPHQGARERERRQRRLAKAADPTP